MDLRVDDVIVEVEGTPIHRFEDLPAALGQRMYGDEVHIAYVRHGARREVGAALGPFVGEPFFKFNPPPVG
jgi:S1-C subfamily serine protease